MLLFSYPCAEIDVLKTQQMDISSSKIRQAIKAGEDLQNLLPEDIIKYIDTHNLYKGADVESI